MRDIATATLSGNLTRDVELKSLPSGTDVARLRVATTTRRRSARSGSRRPTTSPSRCTAPRRATARSTCARARAWSWTPSSTGASGPTGRQEARGGHVQGPPGAVRGRATRSGRGRGRQRATQRRGPGGGGARRRRAGGRLGAQGRGVGERRRSAVLILARRSVWPFLTGGRRWFRRRAADALSARSAGLPWPARGGVRGGRRRRA